jgi:hypothetical protein
MFTMLSTRSLCNHKRTESQTFKLLSMPWGSVLLLIRISLLFLLVLHFLHEFCLACVCDAWAVFLAFLVCKPICACFATTCLYVVLTMLLCACRIAERRLHLDEVKRDSRVTMCPLACGFRDRADLIPRHVHFMCRRRPVKCMFCAVIVKEEVMVEVRHPGAF